MAACLLGDGAFQRPLLYDEDSTISDKTGEALMINIPRLANPVSLKNGAMASAHSFDNGGDQQQTWTLLPLNLRSLMIRLR